MCTLFIRHGRTTSFSSAHTESKTQQNIMLMIFTLKLGVRIFLLDARWPPLFCSGRSLPFPAFLILPIILKNKKNLYVGSFNYFSYAIHIGSNWYMNTALRDLEVAFFKANSTWFNDICSKDLSNRPIYSVLNTHNLDMILQLKYMPIVMNLARIASSDWKS